MQGIKKTTEEKKSFWPTPVELRNSELWSYVGLGAMAEFVLLGA